MCLRCLVQGTVLTAGNKAEGASDQQVSLEGLVCSAQSGAKGCVRFENGTQEECCRQPSR